MVNKILTKDNTGIYSDKVDDIDGAGVVVDDGAYNAGTFKDREYDVRGFKSFSIDVENIGANSVDAIVEASTKDFSDIAADLDDADYNVELKAEIAVTATSRVALIDETWTTPRFTAVRLRCKETVGGSPGTIRGDIKGAR